jgi:hypothetical protein
VILAFSAKRTCSFAHRAMPRFRLLPPAAQKAQQFLQRSKRPPLAGLDVLDLALPVERRRLLARFTPQAHQEGNIGCRLVRQNGFSPGLPQPAGVTAGAAHN